LVGPVAVLLVVHDVGEQKALVCEHRHDLVEEHNELLDFSFKACDHRCVVVTDLDLGDCRNPVELRLIAQG